jgi:hypothetical protein
MVAIPLSPPAPVVSRRARGVPGHRASVCLIAPAFRFPFSNGFFSLVEWKGGGGGLCLPQEAHTKATNAGGLRDPPWVLGGELPGGWNEVYMVRAPPTRPPPTPFFQRLFSNAFLRRGACVGGGGIPCLRVRS